MRPIDADHLKTWVLSWWERTEPTSEYIKGKDILDQIDREPTIEPTIVKKYDTFCGVPMAEAVEVMQKYKEQTMNDFEHGCQFCHYEYFDARAYPCSMCIYGEERTDKFQMKSLVKCYKCRHWNYEHGCQSKYKCEFEPYRKESE